MYRILYKNLQLSLLSIVFLLFFCNKNQKTEATVTPVPEQKTVQTAPAPDHQSESLVEVITSFDHLDSIIKNSPNDLLIFDLYADWCRPCKILAPMYSSLAKKHHAKARFFRVDVQKHRDIASAFRVSGIPMVVFMKNKEIVSTIRGLRPQEQYETVITSCGASVSEEECRKKLEAAL
jgi:thioredoxin 1